jgi:hypothetical protein
MEVVQQIPAPQTAAQTAAAAVCCDMSIALERYTCANSNDPVQTLPRRVKQHQQQLHSSSSSSKRQCGGGVVRFTCCWWLTIRHSHSTAQHTTLLLCLTQARHAPRPRSSVRLMAAVCPLRVQEPGSWSMPSSQPHVAAHSWPLSPNPKHLQTPHPPPTPRSVVAPPPRPVEQAYLASHTHHGNRLQC